MFAIFLLINFAEHSCPYSQKPCCQGKGTRSKTFLFRKICTYSQSLARNANIHNSPLRLRDKEEPGEPGRASKTDSSRQGLLLPWCIVDGFESSTFYGEGGWWFVLDSRESPTFIFVYLPVMTHLQGLFFFLRDDSVHYHRPSWLANQSSVALVSTLWPCFWDSRCFGGQPSVFSGRITGWCG